MSEFVSILERIRPGYKVGGVITTPKRGLVDEPGSYAGNPLFGKEITGKMQEGKIFGKNKERLDKLKKIIQESNGSYKKNITAHEALVKAGWKDGYQSIGTTQKIRPEVAKAMEKLLTTQEKIDNYINNVMLAEDAVVKDFKSPQQHIAKKFGVSKSFMDKWAVKSKVYQENKKLFTGLRNELSFNKYKTLPDGTPRSIPEFSEIIQNKLPYKQSFFGGSSREKFIMDSAYRHHKYAKDAGKSSQIRFIGDPDLMPANQWQFIKGDKLYSLDPALDNVVYQGTTYKNNYLNRVDAADLYKNDFGEVYKAFDDLDVYMNTMVDGPDGKPIKLDTLLRRKAFDETGKEDFLRRRFAEIDHDDIMKKPFSDLRLLDRQTNARAGILSRLNKYKNNPKLRNKTLTDIGYLNRDKDVNAFIKRMTKQTGELNEKQLKTLLADSYYKEMLENYEKNFDSLSPRDKMPMYQNATKRRMQSMAKLYAKYGKDVVDNAMQKNSINLDDLTKPGSTSDRRRSLERKIKRGPPSLKSDAFGIGTAIEEGPRALKKAGQLGVRGASKVLGYGAIPLQLYFMNEARKQGKSTAEILAMPLLMEGRVGELQDMMKLTPVERQGYNRAKINEDESLLDTDFYTPDKEGIELIDNEATKDYIKKSRKLEEALRRDDRSKPKQRFTLPNLTGILEDEV